MIIKQLINTTKAGKRTGENLNENYDFHPDKKKDSVTSYICNPEFETQYIFCMESEQSMVWTPEFSE